MMETEYNGIIETKRKFEKNRNVAYFLEEDKVTWFILIILQLLMKDRRVY